MRIFRPGDGSREPPFVWGGIAALVAIASLLRQEGTPAWQSLWAEDGTLFLHEALKDGAGSFAEAYNGYGHLVPRSLAFLAVHLPLAWAPWLLSVGAAVVVGLVAAFIYTASASHVRHRGVRLLVAATAGLCPVAQTEALNNAANLQWFLMMGLFWALLWMPQSRPHQVAAGLMGLAAFGSAPVAVLLLPLYGLRLLVLRRRALDGLLVGSIAGLAYQLTITSHAGKRLGNAAPLNDLLQAWLTHGVLELVGEHPAHVLARNLGWASVVLVIAAVALAVLVGGWREVGLLAAACVLLSGLTFTVSLAHGSQVLPAGLFDLDALDLVDGSRYALFPVYLLSVVVLVSLDVALRGARPLRLLAVVPALVLMGFGLTTDFRGGPFRSSSPHWASQLSTARGRCARGDQDVPLRIAPPAFSLLELCSVVRAHD